MNYNLKVVFSSGENEYSVNGYFDKKNDSIKTFYDTEEDLFFTSTDLYFMFDNKDEANLFLDKLKTFDKELDAILLDYIKITYKCTYRYITSYGHLDTKFNIGEITYEISNTPYYKVEVQFNFVDNEINHITENISEIIHKHDDRGKSLSVVKQ